MGVEIGKLHVRRSGFMQASPERVWSEFADSERLAAWFGQGQRLEKYDPRLGGEMRLSIESGGERRAFGGAILVFEPARELTYTSNWDDDAWPVPTLITLRLTPLYDGCHVEIFQHGFERFGADAAAQLAGYEDGWNTRHLVALKAIVEA